MSLPPPSIVILGAGSIGCYLGGCLAAANIPVTLIGRERIRQAIQDHGLRVTDWQGRNVRVPYAAIGFSLTPEILAKAEVILVTVKGGDTEAAARSIAEHGAPQALVVSFQNGLRNGGVLRQRLPTHRVLCGMVPFNVVNAGEGHFHCGTEGHLAMETLGGDEQPLRDAFERAGLPIQVYRDILPVQWGKLLMNLNNPINALSGMPLIQQLQQRDYRRVLAASIREALQILEAAGIQPARTGKVIPALMPAILSLPTPLFRLVARAMLKIDPQARSSMAEDLALKRNTEIDFLNGEVMKLAESLGLSAPINQRIHQLVKQAEQARQGSPQMTAAELLAAITA